jgi:phosphoribosylformylglycinamidine (FGAM) synthase PurS component
MLILEISKYPLLSVLPDTVLPLGVFTIISILDGAFDIIIKTPNGSTVSGRTDNNGYLEISNISIAGEYAIVRIGNQNITQDEIQKIVLSVKSFPVVNSIEISGASTSFCANSDIDIIIKGTLNSIVDLEATKIGFLLPAPGIVLDTPIVGYPNEGYGIARFKFS